VARPDFRLSVTIGGERREVVAREVPAAAFFEGFPDLEDIPGLDLATERWLDALLGRVVVEPALTIDLVHRLGWARDELLAGYFRAIGVGVKEPSSPSLLRAVVEVIGDDPVACAIQVAKEYGALPSLVWADTISAFVFNAKTVIERLPADRGRLPVYTNDPRLVGVN
jgi:hypothetical protein